MKIIFYFYFSTHYIYFLNILFHDSLLLELLKLMWPFLRYYYNQYHFLYFYFYYLFIFIFHIFHVLSATNRTCIILLVIVIDYKNYLVFQLYSHLLILYYSLCEIILDLYLLCSMALNCHLFCFIYRYLNNFYSMALNYLIRFIIFLIFLILILICQAHVSMLFYNVFFHALMKSNVQNLIMISHQSKYQKQGL